MQSAYDLVSDSYGRSIWRLVKRCSLCGYTIETDTFGNERVRVLPLVACTDTSCSAYRAYERSPFLEAAE